MKKVPWNTEQARSPLLLVVALAVTGGCEEPTTPRSAPGEAEHRLAAQAGATDATREALMALYDALDGDNWTDNTNWGSDEDLEDWHGIATFSDGTYQLVLRDNGLSGEIPAEVGDLGAVDWLLLGYNPGLSGSIPPELGNLSSLRQMSFYNSGISGSIPAELGNLSELTMLELRNNGLSGSIPPELANITGLEILFIDGNELSGGLPPGLGNLTAIHRMSITDNRLTGAIPNTFLNLYMDEFNFEGNSSLCIPNTAAFKSWIADLEYPDFVLQRNLCSPDREALLGLHDAMDGSNWADSNWGNGTDIRSWRGVTVDSDVRVTELRLGSIGLSGRIPTVLADLDRLKVLVLKGNGLVGEVPESVMDLDLDVFWWSDNPGLCIPDTEAFRTWLSDMRSTSGPICGH